MFYEIVSDKWMPATIWRRESTYGIFDEKLVESSVEHENMGQFQSGLARNIGQSI